MKTTDNIKVVLFLLGLLFFIFGCKSASSSEDSSDALTVVSVYPADSSTDVASNTVISVTFSQIMNPLTITANTDDADCSGTFQVSDDNFSTCIRMTTDSPPNSNFAANLQTPSKATTDDNITFRVTLAVILTENTTYKIRVTTGAKANDSSNKTLDSEYTTPNGFTTEIQYTIGGSVSGLAGTGLVLQNNGADDLTITADGAFTFATAIADGSDYTVTVFENPTGLSQVCTTSNDEGSVAGADVTDVDISCVTNTYTVGGSVSGLGSWGGLVLRNNSGDDLNVDANGSFGFATALTDGSSYSVTIETQPDSQSCSVSNPDGTLGGSNITGTSINCKTFHYFAGNDGSTGWELWKTDGTTAGTVLVKDIHPSGSSLNDQYDDNPKTMVNGILFFSAESSAEDRELWKSDGTLDGTVMVKDIRSGDDGSFPTELTNVNGILFFSANDGNDGIGLWKSDGTEGGTVMVKNIYSNGGGSDPEQLTNVNGTLFFSAEESDGRELWKSDGTEGGTIMVKEINTETGGSSPEQLANVDGTLFFSADDSNVGYELWKSDGTEGGTAMVKDISSGGNDSNPKSLINIDGTLFFSANDNTNGRELWKSDGTESGTVMIKDIKSGSWSDPLNLTNVNGILFFRADDGTNGQELWKSDGTEGGTVMVKNIRSGDSPSSPVQLTNVNGTLFFSANDGVNGRELWKSGGTESGTILVKDIVTTSGSSDPIDLTFINDSLFFTADDGNGFEPWKSDGTSADTEMIKEVNPGSGDGAAGPRPD